MAQSAKKKFLGKSWFSKWNKLRFIRTIEDLNFGTLLKIIKLIEN